MREQQRQRGRSAAADVEDVDAEAVDVDAPMRQLVERRFLRAPVELVAPRAHERGKIASVRPAAPIAGVDFLGQPGPLQPDREIGEDGIGDVDRNGVTCMDTWIPAVAAEASHGCKGGTRGAVGTRLATAQAEA